MLLTPTTATRLGLDLGRWVSLSLALRASDLDLDLDHARLPARPAL